MGLGGAEREIEKDPQTVNPTPVTLESCVAREGELQCKMTLV